MATISEALATATDHHRAGRLKSAEQVYRQILAVEPNHADAWHLLGLIAHQVGRHAVAVEYIGNAIRLRGDQAPFHHNLGDAFRALQRNTDAVACYRRALELKPDLLASHNNLGLALQQQGQFDEAVACYRRALEVAPNDAEVHNNLGCALKDQGKREEAVVCYRRALELNPEYAEAYNNLGLALKGEGNLDESLACYRRALELKPNVAEIHNNLGIVFEELGDLQDAENFFRSALRHNPRSAVAHYRLARLLGGKLPEEDLAAQRRLLEEANLTDAQRLSLHFGLAQVLDARGEYAEAAAHLDRGNALQLAEWRKIGQEYDPQAFAFFVTQMITTCTPEFFERVRGFGLESELPVFVIGLPRSGTTLVEQILASHSQIHGGGELSLARESMAALGGRGAAFIEGLRCLDRPLAQRVASRHLERLRALNREAIRIVCKTTGDYFYLGLLASLFPRAKVIHCRRDLRDVAVSCWMTAFQEFRWTNDQQHIASRFHEHHRIMEHWRKVLPIPLLEVDYEDLVADLEGVARKLVAWCGVAWEPACLEFYRTKRPVITSSSVQVRQPVFRTSVGRWKNYEHALASLFARLENEEGGSCAGR